LIERKFRWAIGKFGLLNGAHEFEILKGNIPFEKPAVPKEKFSVTADILSYNRCAIQYGYYVDKGFVAASATQLFFGLVIHGTLDRIHTYFRGDIDKTVKHEVPNSETVKRYFNDTVTALKNRKIYCMGEKAKETALKYIQHFNENHGEEIYPKIIDTEYKLQIDKGNYIMWGVVDVLAKNEYNDNQSKDDFKNYEIWDFKSGSKPIDNPEILKDYEFQMLVYADLYRKRTGSLPSKSVLFFIGEDGDNKVEIDINSVKIKIAVKEFERIVNDIQKSKETNNWTLKGRQPPKDTCSACDFRWGCDFCSVTINKKKFP